jgi:hypothetical protein
MPSSLPPLNSCISLTCYKCETIWDWDTMYVYDLFNKLCIFWWVLNYILTRLSWSAVSSRFLLLVAMVIKYKFKMCQFKFTKIPPKRFFPSDVPPATKLSADIITTKLCLHAVKNGGNQLSHLSLSTTQPRRGQLIKPVKWASPWTAFKGGTSKRLHNCIFAFGPQQCHCWRPWNHSPPPSPQTVFKFGVIFDSSGATAAQAATVERESDRP